jgi:microcystin-dependent protein
MDPLLGQITLFAGNFAPRDWAFCDGQLLAISQNTALFSILGTTYGGDGRTTFALPDLRGRAPIHSGSGSGPGLSPRQLGSRSGTEINTLNVTQMPSHNHTSDLKVSSGNAAQQAATGGSSIATPGAPGGRGFDATYGFNQTTPDTSLNGASVTTGNTGGSSPVNNMQPYLAINYIIALVGIFPSRN